METKPIPAPIDNKNVSTDWIEYIFDNANCTNGGAKDEWFVGFVSNYIASAMISSNKLVWRLHMTTDGFTRRSDVLAILLKRLKDYDKECDEPECNLYCEYRVNEGTATIVQTFYFKNDD